jgi:transcriptional regulator with XRE-family HTH domain
VYHACMQKHNNRLGTRVKSFREVAGISQYTLADLSGLHRNTIARIELGVISPKISTLDALAKALKVRAADLLSTGGGR